MPVRFRCAYCNQLMGISHRKAGTVVRCPKCAGEIIVPAPDGAAPAPEELDQAAATQGATEQPAAHDPIPPPQPELPPADLPAMLLPPPPPQRPGLFLSKGTLVVSLAVIVLLLVLVFFLGLIIGRQS